MIRLVMACVVALGVLAIAPMKANAGVYIRAPYFSLNVGRPYYRPYYRPYRYYSYRPYYRLSLSQMSSGWRETTNRVMLTPDVGRLQTALVAAHRVIPIPSVT